MTHVVSTVTQQSELVCRDNLISEPIRWHQWASLPFFLVDREVPIAHKILSAYPDAPLIQLRAGEGLKTLSTYETLIEALLCANVNRAWTLVAIGGGSLLDLVGFVAATYHRGLDWVAMPTTCLAQVDAAVGGKTALNFRGHKNVLGAYHPPKTVMLDPTITASLPASLFREGLAEVLKMALLDHELWAFVCHRFPDILSRNLNQISKMIMLSIGVKKRFVQSDPLDTGLRMSLNLGHTLAHAIELKLGISHGEAVAIGLNFALFVSEKHLGTPKALRQKLTGLLLSAHLPIYLPKTVNPAELVELIQKDKKQRENELKFIGLADVGVVKIIQRLSPHELADKLSDFQACYAKSPEWI